MKKAINRVPGRWLEFARDWDQGNQDIPEAFCIHTDAMEGLIFAQQHAAVAYRSRHSLIRALEFKAFFKVPHWPPANEYICAEHTHHQVKYAYHSGGQTCFEGHLCGMLAADAHARYRGTRQSLAPQLMQHKVQQFHTFFPQVEYIWIVLSTVVTSHFFLDYYSQIAIGILEEPPQMLVHKVQFDQRALDKHVSRLGVSPLVYFAETFKIGGCDAITLTAELGGQMLMRIDLGILRPLVSPHRP